MKSRHRVTSPSVTLFGLALVLLYSPGDSSRARRRHPPSADSWSPSSHLTREDSSIPGVSIWTSKSAAVSRAADGVPGRRRKYSRLPEAAGRRHPCHDDFSCLQGGEGDSSAITDNHNRQAPDQRTNLGDADVEPPSRGAREGQQEGVGQREDEYAGVLTSEEDEEDGSTADALPGRLLEEGGGSDSQEDDTDEDDGSEGGDGDDGHDDRGDDSDGQDSYDDGWGGDALSRGSRRGSRGVLDGDKMEGAPSLEKVYEEDEEACFARVKELWEGKIMAPPSLEAIGEISEGVKADQKRLMEAAPTEWNVQFSEGEGNGSGNGPSQGLLYRLLLAEMQGDGPSGGLNNRWIDRDALLQLRGAATLAHHPEYLRHTANLPRVSRGVRIVAPEATHSMQEALARSLSHSTGSKLVLLDNKILESVRERALSEGVPKERLTSRHLTSALLEVAREDGSPFVIFFKDKGSAVLKSRGMCQRLTEELKSESSRVLFLLSTASDPSVPGNSGVTPGEDTPYQEAAPQQDGAQPKKNFIFLQQAPPEGADGGGYFGGRAPRGGRGGRSGGRGGGPWNTFGRGAPPGAPFPTEMLEQLFKEAMKNAHEQSEQNSRESGDRTGGSPEQGDGSGTPKGHVGGGGGDQLPPGLMEALGEALNDDEFKRNLEQIAKQMGKDMQGFSIMFSTTSAPPGTSGGGRRGEDADDDADDDAEDRSDGDGAQPWGAAGPSGASPGNGGNYRGFAGGSGNWQGSGSSSLSWLTNLRKGIMNADEVREDDGSNEEHAAVDEANAGSGGKRLAGSIGGGGGDGSGDGEEGRKVDMRRGVDVTPSSTEMRAFVSSFEDLVVNPPQDAVLRQHWDAWVKEDVGRHNTQQNRQALMAALRRNMMACPELRLLDPLLAKHRLTEAETGQVVLSALKVELTKAVTAAAAAFSEEHLQAGSVPSDEDAFSSSPPSLILPLLAPRKTGKGRLIISRRSMETAFAAVCKGYVPRPGHPMSRTREEVTALAQHDRHEQALVTNVILPKDIGVTYDMIGGLGGAKELLRECITYPLRFPHLYSEGIAKEAVKGVLLFGPPGTGKTMLAKAVATEGGATFLSVDASVIENKWLGESEKNARAVFTLARRLAPCVIYIDEVDSVLSSREKYDDSTHGTLTSVKTTLMQEWDGLRTGGDRVVVIASTNRPFDLDEAVLRRLPRRILVDLPDAETREEILKVSMAQNRVDENVNYTAITQELEGFTGSDIKEVCREAVVRIAHEKAHELDSSGVGPGEEVDLTAKLRPVTMEDFWEARKKLTASVSEKGRELARVWEWNEEYGEVKKKRSDTSAQHLSMYL